MKKPSIAEGFKILSCAAIGMLLLFSACTSPVGDSPEGQDGVVGEVALSIGASSPRTLLPNEDPYFKGGQYTFKLTAPGREPVIPKPVAITGSSEQQVTISNIPTGRWRIEVTREFKNENAQWKPIAKGEFSDLIVEGGKVIKDGNITPPATLQYVLITMRTQWSDNDEGTLHYANPFPAAAGVESAVLNLYALNPNGSLGTSIESVDLQASGEYTRSLPNGYYFLTVKAKSSQYGPNPADPVADPNGGIGDARYDTKTEVVHIYSNAITEIPWTAIEDFDFRPEYYIDYAVKIRKVDTSDPSNIAITEIGDNSAGSISGLRVLVPERGAKTFKVTAAKGRGLVRVKVESEDGSIEILDEEDFTSDPTQYTGTIPSMPHSNVMVTAVFEIIVTAVDMKPFYIRRVGDPSFTLPSVVLPDPLRTPGVPDYPRLYEKEASISGMDVGLTSEGTLTFSAAVITRIRAVETQDTARTAKPNGKRGYSTIIVLPPAASTDSATFYSEEPTFTTTIRDGVNGAPGKDIGGSTRNPVTSVTIDSTQGNSGWKTDSSDQKLAYKFTAPGTKIGSDVEGIKEGSGVAIKGYIANVSGESPKWTVTSYQDTGWFYDLNGAQNAMTDGQQGSKGDLQLEVIPVLFKQNDVPYVLLVHVLKNDSDKNFTVPMKFGAAMNIHTDDTRTDRTAIVLPLESTSQGLYIISDEARIQSQWRMGFYNKLGQTGPSPVPPAGLDSVWPWTSPPPANSPPLAPPTSAGDGPTRNYGIVKDSWSWNGDLKNVYGWFTENIYRDEESANKDDNAIAFSWGGTLLNGTNQDPALKLRAGESIVRTVRMTLNENARPDTP